MSFDAKHITNNVDQHNKQSGEALLNCIVTNNLAILNIENEPTFLTRIKKESFNIKLSTGHITVLRSVIAMYLKRHLCRTTGKVASQRYTEILEKPIDTRTQRT